MGRSKCVEAPFSHEIPCVGIYVPYDKSVMDKLLSKDEKDVELVKQHLTKIMAPAKNDEGVLGVNNMQGGILVLIPTKRDGSEKETVKRILSEYAKLGFDAKVANRILYADGRYLDGIYKGFLVALPSPEMEKEIRRILDAHCREWNVTQDPKLGMLYYEGDLGGRNVTIAIQNGDWRLAAGLASGEMHYTREVRKHWKKVLEGLEGDIERWADEHPGLAKKVHSA